MDRIDFALVGMACALALLLLVSAVRAYELHKWAKAQGDREAAFVSEHQP